MKSPPIYTGLRCNELEQRRVAMFKSIYINCHLECREAPKQIYQIFSSCAHPSVPTFDVYLWCFYHKMKNYEVLCLIIAKATTVS